MALRRTLIIGLTLCLLLAACDDEQRVTTAADAADGGTQPHTAQLVEVDGPVRVKRWGEPRWESARVGMELATNDKVRTQRHGFATIRFEEGGVLRLEPESLVAVTDLRIEPRNQVRRSTFTLMQGRVEAELDALDEEDSEFKIKTPSAQASVVRREVAFR